MRRLANALYRDERGGSLVELALTTPMLAFLLLGAVDMGMGYTERLALKQAANRTLEMGMIKGQVNSSYSYLRDVAASASGEPTSNVTIDNWLACDDVRQAAFDGVCGSNQQTARYLSVRITGTHQPLFNYSGLARQFGDDTLGSPVSIAGSAVVRIQ